MASPFWSQWGVLALALASLMPASCAAANSAWPMQGHDSAHTGRSPFVGSQTGALKWSFYGGDGAGAPVLGADGTVFVGLGSASIFALDGATGAPRWNYTTAGVVQAAPAVDAWGTLFVVSDGGTLYALDGRTGAVNWTASPGAGELLSSPILGPDGTLYAGSIGNQLLEYNTRDGTLKRSVPTMHVISSPALNAAAGLVYVIDFGGLVGAAAAPGPRGAQRAGRGRPAAAPASRDRHGDPGPCGMYDDAQMYGINVTTGAIVWCAQLAPVDGGGTFQAAAPAVGSDGTVYISYADVWRTYVAALNGTTGALIWHCNGAGNSYSSPAIDDQRGVVYAGAFTATLVAINATNGTRLWAAGTVGTYSSPAIGADGTVYIGASDNNVYAFNGATGALKWTYKTSRPPGEFGITSGPAIGADGTVFVASGDGWVYAFGA
jgi:outer membrane protein assembly factor BamB